jgi:tetratricopeptide (TPR) repeat protein
MAALTAAADHGLDELLVELAEAVWDPLRTGYHLDDIVTSQTRAAGAARTVNVALAAVITARAAFALTALGDDHPRAVAAADEAVQLADSTDDSWARAMALSTRARALTAAGHIAEAITDLEAALELDRQRGDRRSIALRLRRLGQAYLALDDPGRAVPLLQQSVDEMDAAGDKAGHARSLIYLAQGYLAAGDPNRALDAVPLARKHFEQAGSTRYYVEARLVVARAYRQLGDPMSADEVCAHLLVDLREESGPVAEACRAEILTLKDQLG